MPEVPRVTVMNPIDDLIEALEWSEPKRLETRRGPRMLTSAPLDDRKLANIFWDSWRAVKPEWQERGFSPSKDDDGVWWLNRWEEIGGGAGAEAKERAAESRSATEENRLPMDWVPPDVQLVHPASRLLLNYQHDAAKRVINALRNGNALDASDTGTGKTFVALVAAAELGMTPCVIAPIAVLPSWKRAATMLGVRLGWVINYEKIRTGNTELGDWTFEQQFILKYLPPAPLVVFDECHKSKGDDTLNGRMLRTISAKHPTLCLSATAAKDPLEMRNLGAALKLHDGTPGGFRRFCKANGVVDGMHGFWFKGGSRALERIHHEIFPLKGNRIRVADLPDFPETQIVAETLECDTLEIAKAYKAADAKIAELKADLTLSAAERSSGGMAAQMAARQAAERGKLGTFAELTHEAIDEGKSVAVFLNFRDHISDFAEAMKTKCLVWGGQKAEERQAHIDDFNADRQRIIIVSLQAGGAGLSLHDLHGDHPRLSIISPSFSAVDLKQSLGRVHRAGAKTKSQQRIIFAAGTVEEEICDKVRLKLENIDSLNDGTLAAPSLL